MGSLNDDVGTAYAKHALDCNRVSHLVTQAAMYYEVASDTWLENEMSESEFRSGIMDKDNKLYLGNSSEYTQLYPEDLKIGYEFYEIKNEPKITGKSTKKNFAMLDERHFITD